MPSLAGGLGSLTPLLTQDLRPGLICIAAPRLGSLCRARSRIDVKSRSSTRADELHHARRRAAPRARASGAPRSNSQIQVFGAKKKCRQRPTLLHTFACSTIGPAGLNLRRLEGVSARLLRAGAFCRNPERSLRRILTTVFGMGTPRLRRKLNLRIAAGSRGLDGVHHPRNICP